MEGSVVVMTVSNALADVTTAISSAVGVVEAHPVLQIFLGFSIVGAAIGTFATIKGAVR